jgi:glycosyltransferase involved in cell wall biosynthesis
MMIGRPLVCADLPYARELCEDHAVFVDPYDPESLVDVWRRWPAPVERLEPATREQLERRFSWRDHVTRLVDTLLGR